MLAVLLFMDGKESSGCGMSTADGGKVVMENDANDDGAVDENMSQKRERKMTAKGVSLLFENLQRSRKQKLNQVNKIKQKVNDIYRPLLILGPENRIVFCPLCQCR